MAVKTAKYILELEEGNFHVEKNNWSGLVSGGVVIADDECVCS
jgi:hypothetical protein